MIFWDRMINVILAGREPLPNGEGKHEVQYSTLKWWHCLLYTNELSNEIIHIHRNQKIVQQTGG